MRVLLLEEVKTQQLEYHKKGHPAKKTTFEKKLSFSNDLCQNEDFDQINIFRLSKNADEVFNSPAFHVSEIFFKESI